MGTTVGTRAPRQRQSLRPGWPLTAIFIGYPLWWVLGVAEIVPLVAAAIMARQLLHTRRLSVRRGFGIWLLFLAWVAIGVLLLQVNAPGAVPGGSSTRYLTYSFRMGWYLAATITLVYVYNLREQLSTRRITRAAGWLFITVVIGGVVGTLAPHLDFRSAIELLLPRRVTHFQFVHDLVHPVVAQLYTVDGVENPRVSAPFAYTNDWGLNVACLLPFFVVGWLGRDAAGWRRRVGVVVIIVALYPIIESANRGLWLAVLAAAVMVAVRAAFMGHVRMLGTILAAGAVGAVVLVATPLGSSIQTRIDHGYSNNGRASLGARTVDSVVGVSPVVGLGTTRNVQGSFYSIAGGDTATCNICTPPALGTQGHLWLVIYSTGIGGLLLYLGFLLLQFARHVRIHAPPVTLGLSVIVIHLTTMFVYDTIGIALVTIFLAIGLLWREAADAPPRRPGAREQSDPTLGGYVMLLRANAKVIAVCLVLGLLGGVAVQYERGIPATSTTTVLLSPDPVYQGSPTRPQTIDTIAALINSPRVLSAISKAAGREVRPDDAALSVTAAPNTRLLSIHYTARSAVVAASATEAAAKALINERADILQGQVDQSARALQTQQNALLTAITTIDSTPRAGRVPRSAERAALLARANTISHELTRVEVVQVSGGAISEHARTHFASDRWLVAMCTGVMIGFVVALLIGLARHTISRTVGRNGHPTHLSGLLVLDRLRAATRDIEPPQLVGASGRSRSRLSGELSAQLSRVGTTDFLSVGRDPSARRVASQLDRTLAHERQDPITSAGTNVVVVAGPRDRIRDIDRLRTSLEHEGAAVTGLVLVGQTTSD